MLWLLLLPAVALGQSGSGKAAAAAAASGSGSGDSSNAPKSNVTITKDTFESDFDGWGADGNDTSWTRKSDDDFPKFKIYYFLKKFVFVARSVTELKKQFPNFPHPPDGSSEVRFPNKKRKKYHYSLTFSFLSPDGGGPQPWGRDVPHAQILGSAAGHESGERSTFISHENEINSK